MIAKGAVTASPNYSPRRHESQAELDIIGRLSSLRQSAGGVWATFDKQTAETFVGLFHRLDAKNKRVLEIGSGHGFTCVLFGALGAGSVQGIEVVPSAVEYATRLRREVAPHAPVHFVRGNAADGLPYSDRSIDVVLAIEVLSHIRAEPASVLRECARVLAPGGLLFVSDGNNARSWFRRRQNQEIWRRFEQGPPTRAGETVHTHLIAEPYVQIRKRLARQYDDRLTEEEAARIADGTFQYTSDELRQAVSRYRSSGIYPAQRYEPGKCPVEPLSGMYIEQLLDPIALRSTLKQLGFQTIHCAPRRTLPAASLWSTFPRLTFLVSNGFTVLASRG